MAPGIPCGHCGREDAPLQVEHSGAWLCKPCYKRFFEGRVQRAIDRSKMLRHDTKIMVGVSWSVESLALVLAVRELEARRPKARVSYVYVRRWTDGAEEEALRTVLEGMGIAVEAVPLTDMAGLTVDWMARNAFVQPGEVCRACKNLVQAALERQASNRGFEVVLCGDTADEAFATVLKDLASGRIDRVKALKPLRAERGASWGYPLLHALRSEARRYLEAFGVAPPGYDCPHRPEAERDVRRIAEGLEARHRGIAFASLRSLARL